jgi:hypothetical protein
MYVDICVIIIEERATLGQITTGQDTIPELKRRVQELEIQNKELILEGKRTKDLLQTQVCDSGTTVVTTDTDVDTPFHLFTP